MVILCGCLVLVADEQKKAELSENVVFNANNMASILARRPDIVGKVAGRFTTLDQMAGTNDPDITSLQQDMHNIAIANVGIHGMRANDAVHDVETNILNNFKNGPLCHWRGFEVYRQLCSNLH